MEVVEKDGQETLKNFNADEALENLESVEQVETTQENVEETQQTEEPEEVREVQATEETDEPEEASPKKKSRLQRRIDELVRERAAANEDRNKLYGQVQQLSQELQSKTALNKDYSSLQKDYYDSQMEAANSSLVSARTSYKTKLKRSQGHQFNNLYNNKHHSSQLNNQTQEPYNGHKRIIGLVMMQLELVQLMQSMHN